MCLSIFSRQLLGINVTEATNTQATTEETLEASFSMQSVSYQNKVGEWFFAEFIVSIMVIRRVHLGGYTVI
jgi:hypothetical protein